MDTPEPEAIEQLLLQIWQIKHNDKHLTSKLEDLNRTIDLHVFRQNEIVSCAPCASPENFRPSRPRVARLKSLPTPSCLTFESEFGDILTYLDETTRSFIKTSDDVASYLESAEDSDWSAAVILLCKAFERETIRKILIPLQRNATKYDLSGDLEDVEFKRIAKFFRSSGTPPELGTLGRFLKTASHSVKRRNSSGLLRAFYEMVNNWPESNWIVDPLGLVPAIERLTTEFRNRAAHIEQLARVDFTTCRAYVRESPDKIIVRLIVATQPHFT